MNAQTPTHKEEIMASPTVPMRFHGPGWTLDIEGGNHYWLWAPQDGSIPDPFNGTWASTNRRRKHWAASWQSDDGEDGDFVKGKSADEVLRSFPVDVRRIFESVLP